MAKKKQRHRHLLAGLLALTAICAVTTGAVYDAYAKEITITQINEFTNTETTKTVKTRSDSVRGVLEKNEIVIGDNDSINLHPDSPLEDNAEIIVRRGVPITVSSDGSVYLLSVTEPTVGEALTEAGILLSENDLLSVDQDATIAPDMHIVVTNRNETTETHTITVPRETVYKDDSTLKKGSTKTVDEGQDGIIEITEQIVYTDGEETERTELSRVTIREAKPEIISRGTAVSTPAPTSTAAPAAKSATADKVKKTATPKKEAAEDTGGAINGRSYKKKLQMTSTAYSAFTSGGGYGTTATGVPSKYGVVAVDPRVIPLGTKLYVEGYGTAIAADTGGAIKGNKIDLCFEQSEKALRAYGVKKVNVYILD